MNSLARPSADQSHLRRRGENTAPCRHSKNTPLCDGAGELRARCPDRAADDSNPPNFRSNAPSSSSPLILAARRLGDVVGCLKFSAPVTHVYNPLAYAWSGHEQYLQKFGNGPKRVVFLGMNPGPFGMVQTGVPFGEIKAVRDWLGIECAISRPKIEHPRRLVTGFDCARSEISGQRLWGLFAERFGSPAPFFAEHFVLNYCPLAFLEETGRNRTPDKLPAIEQQALFKACDEHLL